MILKEIEERSTTLDVIIYSYASKDNAEFPRLDANGKRFRFGSFLGDLSFRTGKTDNFLSGHPSTDVSEIDYRR
jgi:hypothetical protein